MTARGERAPRAERTPPAHFAVGLARAMGGALIFGLPMLMTMEMWWLGFTMDPLRLALLLVVTLPLLVGLSHVSGFERTFDLRQDAADACVACAVGFVVGAAALALFGVLRPGMSLDELLGKVALQAVPGSIGALLAQSQLGGRSDEEGSGEVGREEGEGGGRPSSHASQLFLMAVGALFLAFNVANVAPTEEILLIGYQTGPWYALALVAASLVVMHAFVYALEFTGQEAVPPGTPAWSVFLRYTVTGYAVVLLICAYVLWTFGRLDGTGASDGLAAVLVLGFPGAVGAAAARLIL
jgi:putative integral membrane protein (TIGR02587 family)